MVKLKFNWKPFATASMAIMLGIQPMLAQALTLEYVEEVKVDYPDEFVEKIEDIKTCLTVAEGKIYDSIEGTDYSFDEELVSECEKMIEKYELDEEKTAPDDFSEYKESELKYLKETRELRIALEMFVKLNGDIQGDIVELQKNNDMVDQVVYRIFNLLYELPKVQGHPLVIEFVRDVRDSFINVNRSTYFKNLVYFFRNENPDKELEEDLLRFVYHIEQAENFVGINDDDKFVPDEDMVVELPKDEVSLPDYVDPDFNHVDQSFEDLETVWETEVDRVQEEIKVEKPPVVVKNTAPKINREEISEYTIQDDKCMKITQTYENGKLVKTDTMVAPESDSYRCGRVEDLNWFEDENYEEIVNYTVSFNYGKAKENTVTKYNLVEPLFDYQSLVNVLKVVSSEHGVGAVGGKDRYLFTAEGKGFILDHFEEKMTVDEVNEWLKSKEIPLEIILDTPQLEDDDETEETPTKEVTKEGVENKKN